MSAKFYQGTAGGYEYDPEDPFDLGEYDTGADTLQRSRGAASPQKFTGAPWFGRQREGASAGRVYSGREMRPGYKGSYADYGAQEDWRKDRNLGYGLTALTTAAAMIPTAEEFDEKEALAEAEDRLAKGEYLDPEEEQLFAGLRAGVQRFGAQKRAETESQLATTGQTGAAAQLGAKEAEQRVVGEQERAVGMKKIEAGLAGAQRLREEVAQRRATKKQEQIARRQALVQGIASFADIAGKAKAKEKGEATSNRLIAAVEKGDISAKDALMLRSLESSDQEALIRALGAYSA